MYASFLSHLFHFCVCWWSFICYYTLSRNVFSLLFAFASVSMRCLNDVVLIEVAFFTDKKYVSERASFLEIDRNVEEKALAAGLNYSSLI